MEYHMRNGFTLIELLIVVAIIGILAAIAVPNFLNAQIRAKVARVQGELRAISVALDSYQIDNNEFPWPKRGGNTITVVHELTTPVSYLTSVNFDDPFAPQGKLDQLAVISQGGLFESYVYVHYRGRWGKDGNQCAGRYNVPISSCPKGYGMKSTGPDLTNNGGVHWALEMKLLGGEVTPGNPIVTPGMHANDRLYNSSNGLYSFGDIVRAGGAIYGSGGG
ncbi:MAG: prepilin-type N-terminal cleavage/methylation domain-containing protein [candidate division Zixibacteria bacterium]|nr:prepilin-type N-terminal cleavage/methylation domain-containing protein [candidate division Zixibacteria bacterium]